MLLTPPDVISQVLLAIPVWLLFELGLVLSRIMVKKNTLKAGDLGDGKSSKQTEEQEAESNESDNKTT